MRHARLNLTAAALALALLAVGCTPGGYAPAPSMPAARAGLRPEYRMFFDALQDYGDWVLIEPLGFVFRPRPGFANWRPYTDGFWSPSDAWGWVWISAEPFGWATYHYGSWFYDRYQGWVWAPGLDWGPAWVNWQTAGDYAGWAPLPPPGMTPSTPPGGNYVFVPLTQLATTDLRSQLVQEARLGPAAAQAQPVENTALRDGVRIPLGPSFMRVERALGAPLPRPSLHELVTGPAARSGAAAPATPSPGPAPVAGGARPGVDPAAIEATRRAGEEAAARTRAAIGRDAPLPARVPLHRPQWIRRAEAEGAKRPPSAAPDTTR